MTFCDVGYDRIWVISKKQDFTKKHNTPSIFTLFLIFFFYFVHVSKAKPMLDIRHDLSITVFKLEAIENDDFREKCKISYILKNYLTYIKSDDFCGLSVKK